MLEVADVPQQGEIRGGPLDDEVVRRVRLEMQVGYDLEVHLHRVFARLSLVWHHRRELGSQGLMGAPI